MSKLLVAESALLVLGGVIAIVLVGGVVWLVRRGQRRRRRHRGWRFAAFGRWLTPRRLALTGGGLFLVGATGWSVINWLHADAPSIDDQLQVADLATDNLDGAEWVEVDGALDPAARQKLVSERWRRGLPILLVIGLLVAGWVALAHSGLLDSGQRGASVAARPARKP